MNNDIKKFFIRGFIFSLPILLFLAIPSYILWVSKELINLDKIVNRDTYFIAGFSYSDPLRYVKLNTLVRKSPQIIVMGSSRVSRWRDKFFKEGVFYNAYVGGNQIEDYLIFLNNIPTDKQPKIIFMGLDSDFFDKYVCPINSPETIENIEYQYTNEWARSNNFRVWQYGYTQIYKDYFLNKFRFSDLKNAGDKIGLNAITNGNGFRNDGSYLNNKQITSLINNPTDAEERLIEEHNLSKLSRDSCPDKTGYSLNELNKFLSEAKTRNIYVIGFLTPYARSVLKNINLPQFVSLPNRLRLVFKKHNYNFYNFSDPSVNRGNLIDNEMIDSSHGSEKTDLKIFLYMLERERNLRDYAEISYLKKVLAKSKNNFFIFEQ